MNNIRDVQIGTPVAFVSETGSCLIIVENVTDKYIKTGKGLFHRDTGLPANEHAKGRLSIASDDMKPLLRELERETGDQLISAESSGWNAAVGQALAKAKAL